ncbi:amidase [Salinisphaera sp. SPP-AMP-43]|uniref:amidase n=1 Tax=Salinisphaera sp. SPP-AMP-43 TaxID=3121288 RepID=UPI003C6E4907
MSQSPVQDPVNAFCRDNHVALAPTREGPLSGLTFAAKDVFDIAGTPTGFGQPEWLASHSAASATAEAVTRLVEGGAALVGRTISDELCYSLTGANAHYGAPVNVWSGDRLSGGSSSGSAAATAAGLVDFALGTDCGGSVRVPASYCGLLGIRTTHGDVSTAGLLPFARQFDCVGWFARQADVFTAVGDTLLPAEQDTGAFKKLLVAEDAFSAVDHEIVQALEPGIARVRAEIGSSQSTKLSQDGLERWFETFRILQAADVWSCLGGWIEATQPKLGPGVRERIAQASRIGADERRAAQRHRQKIMARVAEVIGPDDVLVLPSTPQPAPRREGAGPDLETTYRSQAMALLCTAGLAGLPQVSVPLGMIDGLPVGLSLLARRHADKRLLKLAAALCPQVRTPDTIAPGFGQPS